MSTDSVKDKPLFSKKTFDLLHLRQKSLETTQPDLFPDDINIRQEITEFVENPFEELCRLVSNFLPITIGAFQGNPYWILSHTFEQKFSIRNLFYVKINCRGLTIGCYDHKYRELLINNWKSNPEEMAKLILKTPSLGYYDQQSKNISKQEVIGQSAEELTREIVSFYQKYQPIIFLGVSNGSKTGLEEKLKPQPKESYELSQCSQETGFTLPQLTQWKNAINRKGQTIIQGPPGTGKTFIAERLAKHLIGGGDGFSDIIQFHPAYTYEDFIEGLRPITENGQLTYSIVPGRFLQFCEKAEECEDTCVLIIDEINRANLSQVFGELMYLLDDRENTERCILRASGKEFRIPTNVRIIGTMNTADRSIALVDNALRRRFAFIPISPNYEILQNYHNREETVFPIDKLIGILKDVNQAINNKHYELGISFFLTKTLAEDIQDIWQMEIEPYLEEYFFDNQKKMDEFLWDKIKNKLSK